MKYFAVLFTVFAATVAFSAEPTTQAPAQVVSPDTTQIQPQTQRSDETTTQQTVVRHRKHHKHHTKPAPTPTPVASPAPASPTAPATK